MRLASKVKEMDFHEWPECVPRINQLGHRVHARWLLAKNHFANGDHGKVVSQCGKALLLNPDFAPAHLLLGWTHYNLGNFVEAMEKCLTTLRMDNKLIDAFYLKILLHFVQYQDKEVIKSCRNALDIEPKNSLLHFVLGDALYRLERYGKAEKSFRIALKYNHQMDIAHKRLASIYLKQGKDKKAIKEVTLALSLNPISPRARMLLGDIYLKQNDFQAALAEYREATVLNPLMADAHFKAGEAYTNLEQYALSILELRAVLFINRNYAEAYHRLGKIYYKMGNDNLAISHYETALDCRPGFTEARADLSDIMAAKGRLQEAIGEYREIFSQLKRVCPTGDLYFKKKEWLKAILTYRKALELDEAITLPKEDANIFVSESFAGVEKRKNRRYAVKIPLEIGGEKDSNVFAETVDISREGLFIESSLKLELGSEVTVMLGHPEHSDGIPITGKVVRVIKKTAHGDNRFGIQLDSGGGQSTAWHSFFADIDMV